MEKIFKSKIGWWFDLLILSMLTLTILSIVYWEGPVDTIILSLITLLFIHTRFSTSYRITKDEYLIIHCSISPKKKIAIADISSVISTKNPLSSPALSMDRLEIRSEKKLQIIISPKNKQEFVELLKKINPKIEVKGLSLKPKF